MKKWSILIWLVYEIKKFSENITYHVNFVLYLIIIKNEKKNGSVVCILLDIYYI